MPKKIPGSINLLLHYNFRFIVYTAFFIFPLSFTCLLAQIPTPSIQGSSEALHSSLNSSDPMRGNGMSFTPNKGQFVDMNKQQRPDILYKGEGAGADIYLRKSGISYVLSDANETWHKIHEAMEEKEKTHEMTYEDKKVFTEAMMSKMLMKIHRIDVDFVGGNKNHETITSDQIDGYTNYYLGHCPHGITNVNSYNRIIAKNIYPNIDVVYYGGKEKGLKYDIVVNPGGDPNQIKLKYNGAEDVEIKNEKLIIKNSIGEMVEQLPKVYQNIEGKIVDVKAVYKLEHLSNNDVIVHFSFSIFNPSFPLVVDPWATYYSGGGATFTIGTGSGVAADGAGSVIVTGNTSTGDFPVSPGAFQMTPASQGEAFLVKFNVSGTRVFGTYFGGNAGDQGFGMAADGNNDILISGVTASTNFPTKNPGGGAYFQSAMAGNGDAFVAKFSPAGLLIWSTLYGGSGSDQGIDVIADGANNVILTGSTASTNLPTQVPYQAALSGTQDAFVAKFNSGCVRQWATYYGGTSTESAYGVACDAGGNVHFTGNTASTDFPAIAAFQGVAGGGGDAFIVKLNGANGLPLWSTYYGGTLAEWAYGVAVDTPGNCIIVGNTQSANNIASGGANQIANAGNGDGFVVKFNTAGGRLWGTYHGGVNAEVTGGCAVDNKNNIYWYGEVEDEKPNPSWISVCAYQNTYNGAEDQLISKFDPSGKLLCTTAIGGPGEEDFDGGSVAPHFDIAVWDPYLYISAHVRQGGYPVSPGAFQTINRTPAKGENDIFINQLCMNICQQQFLGTTATANKTIVCPNTPISFSSSVYNACDTTGLRFKWTFTGATPSSSTVSNPVISYSTPGFYSVKLVVSTPCQKDSVLKTNYIIVNPCTINATASTSTICSSTCTNITAAGSSGTAPYTYSWNTGGTSATVNVCPATTTDYTVMVTDASGNYAATTTTVFVHPLLSMTSTST
ncbi:MAG: PKD domain-containing protein, partial [Bacteroidia bacterium]|nr:PKD domain-containing protein [Bacteroidia bacterium]